MHSILGGLGWWVCVLVTQSCLTLCNTMDCSPPGSPVHGILQARILEWVAILFSRGSFWPSKQTQVSCITHLLSLWDLVSSTSAHPTTQAGNRQSPFTLLSPCLPCPINHQIPPTSNSLSSWHKTSLLSFPLQQQQPLSPSASSGTATLASGTPSPTTVPLLAPFLPFLLLRVTF